MSMHVIACSHVDMAWKKNREEMKDLFESMIVRALDMMDQAPDFTFVVEQAAHFRQLAETRPDLVDRVRRYVRLPLWASGSGFRGNAGTMAAISFWTGRPKFFCHGTNNGWISVFASGGKRRGIVCA